MRGQMRMTQVERSQNIGENKHHLHRQCLSLRAKRTFHAVLLLPVAHTASSKGQWSKEVWGGINVSRLLSQTVRTPDTEGRGQINQAGCWEKRERGHCCLQVESLRILLAVETPLREGLDDEEDRRSALALVFRDPPSVPFTQTGLATAGLWSASP